jgi:hypothetical protein
MSRTGSRCLAALGFVAFLAAGCDPAKVESARGPMTPEPTGSGGAGGSQAPGGSAGSSNNGGFSLPPPGTTPPADAAAGGVIEPEKSCAAQAFTPQKVPVDMHILVDSSLSMDLPAGNQTKWDRAIRALNTFIADPKSAGLGVGLTFFPNRTPTNVNTCRLDYYATPAVTIAPLPMNAAALNAAINGRARCCDTATRPGMEGVFTYLRAHAAMNPDRRAIFLLITDGLPNGCGAGNTVDAIAEFLRAARTGALSITTYAIGVFGDMDRAEGELALNSWAMAGGSGQPFVLSATENLGEKLVDALNEVRGTALACQFAVPNMPGIDFTKVNVRVQSNGGMDELGYVPSADRCDPVKGGWHYDVDPATSATPPTRVIICPATCNRYKLDATAKVDLLFGCKTRVID